MARLISEARNKKAATNWRIRYEDKNGESKSIPLGRVSKKAAQTIKVFVEDLVSCSVSGLSPSQSTSAWINDVGSDLYDKLAERDLVQTRQRATLEAFIEGFCDRNSDKVKESTLTKYRHTKSNLLEFFDGGRKLDTITTSETEEFRRFLKTEGQVRTKKGKNGKSKIIRIPMAENTVRQRCRIARQMFTDAIRMDLISKNPFDGLPVAIVENRSRDYFVTHEEIAAVLDACPNQMWRTIVALCRYGGLRCPSEIHALKWEGIEWNADRMLIYSPKTEHHEGKASRTTPLWTEMRRELADWQELAPPGQFVFEGIQDKSEAYFRTMLSKAIRRAGLVPWSKLFHNMRVSRQTELMEEHELFKVCRWIGNSPTVALKHYAQMRGKDYAEAVRRSDKIAAPLRRVDCRTGKNGGEAEFADILENPVIYETMRKNVGKVIGRLELIVEGRGHQ